MLSYVYMKLLEGRPESYDRRMDRLSRGRVRAAKRALADEVPRGSQVLEIGCGAGELACKLLERGCIVLGFDASAAMVEAAQAHVADGGLQGFEARQMGVEAMDQLPAARFDAVVSTLVFSELSDDERRYALAQAARVLRPGGLLLVADEVWPRARARRWLHGAARAPLALSAYLVSRSSSRPLEDLPTELASLGFELLEERRSQGDAFCLVVGRLGEAGSS